MKTTRKLHELGQSIWLDNITRDLLNDGTLRRYIDELSVTKALADHGDVGALLPADGGDCEEVLAWFAKAGIDVDALAARLQDEGAKAFVKSWEDLLGVIT